MAKHLQFNESFTEAEIVGLTSIPERNPGDIYKASDTANTFEVLEDLSIIAFSRNSFVTTNGGGSDQDQLISNGDGTATWVSPGAPPDPTNPPYYKAAGSILSDGTSEQIAGASVVRVAAGQYDISFNTAANSATYPVLATMQALPQNDDYQWAYLNRTVNGFRIEIREQDNGGAAGVLRDSGFSFYVPII